MLPAIFVEIVEYESLDHGQTLNAILSHGLAYTTSTREVLLNAVSSCKCYLRNYEDENQMTGVVTKLVGTESPPRGVG